ncbi:uncharacterized protein KY384_002912 [Bacidia gigantensis]|uniref:uncharacterized protein n=1 Tax=Bacidia gigantensis TaxID=2732470 RepID=UPI001D044508|nr:uncharacterized protein KY384_002912 [Bacidia gigantensis]KAG8532427.1 hypothetical protein KY384_002912 [Bacidia gigantensis]
MPLPIIAHWVMAAAATIGALFTIEVMRNSLSVHQGYEIFGRTPFVVNAPSAEDIFHDLYQLLTPPNNPSTDDLLIPKSSAPAMAFDASLLENFNDTSINAILVETGNGTLTAINTTGVSIVPVSPYDGQSEDHVESIMILTTYWDKFQAWRKEWAKGYKPLEPLCRVGKKIILCIVINTVVIISGLEWELQVLWLDMRRERTEPKLDASTSTMKPQLCCEHCSQKTQQEITVVAPGPLHTDDFGTSSLDNSSSSATPNLSFSTIITVDQTPEPIAPITPTSPRTVPEKVADASELLTSIRASRSKQIVPRPYVLAVASPSSQDPYALTGNINPAFSACTEQQERALVTAVSTPSSRFASPVRPDTAAHQSEPPSPNRQTLSEPMEPTPSGLSVSRSPSRSASIPSITPTESAKPLEHNDEVKGDDLAPAENKKPDSTALKPSAAVSAESSSVVPALSTIIEPVLVVDPVAQDELPTSPSSPALEPGELISCAADAAYTNTQESLRSFTPDTETVISPLSAQFTPHFKPETAALTSPTLSKVPSSTEETLAASEMKRSEKTQLSPTAAPFIMPIPLTPKQPRTAVRAEQVQQPPAPMTVAPPHTSGTKTRPLTFMEQLLGPEAMAVKYAEHGVQQRPDPSPRPHTQERKAPRRDAKLYIPPGPKNQSPAPTPAQAPEMASHIFYDPYGSQNIKLCPKDKECTNAGCSKGHHGPRVPPSVEIKLDQFCRAKNRCAKTNCYRYHCSPAYHE